MTKRILSIVLAITMLCTLLPTIALAAGSPAIVRGASPLGVGANTDSAPAVAYGGYEWYVIGYDGEGAAAASGNATLLAKYILGTSKFRNEDANQYSGSLLQEAVDTIARGLSQVETGAVAARDLEIATSAGHYSDGIAGEAVSGAVMWPLSNAEARYLNQNILLTQAVDSDFDEWLLRSPGGLFNYICYVDHLHVSTAADPTDTLGVRPAFHLKLDSVLFTSTAGCKSNCNSNGAAIPAIADADGNRYRVTLLDAYRAGFTATATKKEGDVLTVSYRNAKTGDNEFISVLIEDTTGFTHYARVAAVESASGTAEINLLGIDMEGKTLYVFNEQYNGGDTDEGLRADAASPLRAVSTEVSAPVSTPNLRVNEADNVWEVSYDDGTTWESMGVTAKEYLQPRLQINEAANKWQVSFDNGQTWQDLEETAKEYVIPKLRVNGDDVWEVSYDGGNRWTSLGVTAKEVVTEYVNVGGGTVVERVDVARVYVDDKGGIIVEFTDGSSKSADNVDAYLPAQQPDTEPEPVFGDVASGSWYAKAVEFCSTNGIMKGVSEDEFAPGTTANRAMIITMLACMAGVDTTGGATWYEQAVAWAVEKGVSDGTDLMANITREQFVTMLYRYEKVVNGGGLTGDWMFNLDFGDAGEVSDWANEAMHWAVMNGIINGKGDGTLNPQGTATRAETAQMIMNYMTR